MRTSFKVILGSFCTGLSEVSQCKPCAGGYSCESLGAVNFDYSLNNTGTAPCAAGYFCKSGTLYYHSCIFDMDSLSWTHNISFFSRRLPVNTEIIYCSMCSAENVETYMVWKLLLLVILHRF